MILTLASKLEQFKQLGLDNVQLHYGESVDIGPFLKHFSVQERRVKLTGVPTEFYGRAKFLWAGRLADLLQFDFERMPEALPYPLNESDIFRAEAEGGWFVWGEEQAVKQILERYRR
jgi:hypothetical protein